MRASDSRHETTIRSADLWGRWLSSYSGSAKEVSTALLTFSGDVGAGGLVVNEADQRVQDVMNDFLFTRTQ